MWEKNENTLTNVNVLCVVKIDWCIMFSLFVKIIQWQVLKNTVSWLKKCPTQFEVQSTYVNCSESLIYDFISLGVAI